MNLVYDRTAEDVERALALAKKAEAGTLTDTERTEWLTGMKGCYNAIDLNRVEAAVKSIAAALNAAGYAVEVGETKHTTVPEGYQRLEYIESTGTQYIDTGFKPNQDTRVVCKTVCEVSSTANWVFGARTSNASNQFTFLGASAGTYASGFATAAVNFPASLNTTNPIVVDKNKTVTNINGGNAVTNTTATFTAPVNLALFAVNTNGTISYGKVKLYYVQIYDNGILVRDFIPCKTPSGEIGLYDTITQSFYGNAGTGTFSAGSEIETESHDWQTTDIIRLSQWRQYLANVQALRDAYYTLAETGRLPDAEDRLDYIGANTIEKILADIDLLIGWMKSSYRRCGTFRAGNNAVHLPLKGSAT